MELGRLDRSTYLASYYDELLRRRVNTQLNRQESHHTLARKIFQLSRLKGGSYGGSRVRPVAAVKPSSRP
ncbi:Tn3 family transposase [Nonomuraea sp. NPDC050691]|uniref:Tn3 family transposase n=1 Tax=Nonomuraea sp. NPDC050691 TaxID=3155661 RepID=UPI0033DB56FE